MAGRSLWVRPEAQLTTSSQVPLVTAGHMTAGNRRRLGDVVFLGAQEEGEVGWLQQPSLHPSWTLCLCGRVLLSAQLPAACPQGTESSLRAETVPAHAQHRCLKIATEERSDPGSRGSPGHFLKPRRPELSPRLSAVPVAPLVLGFLAPCSAGFFPSCCPWPPPRAFPPKRNRPSRAELGVRQERGQGEDAQRIAQVN